MSSAPNKIGSGKARSRYENAGLVLLPWFVVAINALVAKHTQIVAQAVPDALVGSPPYRFFNHVYQFAPDLLIGFVVGPIIIFGLLTFIPRRFVLLLVAIASVLWQIVMSAETATYSMANNYATIRTMVMAVGWAIRHPNNQFLTLALYDKINALGFVALVACTVALVYAVRPERAKVYSRASFTILVLGIAATIGSHFAPAEQGPLTSIYKDVASGLVETTDSTYASKSIPELLAAYRQDADLQLTAANASQFEGKAKGYNVVMIVLEATSAEIFDPSRDSLIDMPNVRRLRENSFVGREHFTSYPLTNRASFGLFTSLYSEIPVGFNIHDRDVRLPSMVRDLDDAGYRTGYYGFVWRDEDERDDAMLDAIGFEKITDPLEKAPELPSAELMFGGPIQKTAAVDHQALTLMRQDIRQWTSKKQRFFTAFFPEMGHDPWRNLTGRENASVREMGHALAVYQDKFVGEVIDELQRDGALDHTIILITADHGQRTVANNDGEEVLISHGILDERTMRVPMLIYVPKVLRKTVALDGPTSHIDIAPTLLSLLGVDHSKDPQQGTIMWGPQVARRRLFLPMKVFGASGFYDNGKFYSSNQGMVYRTDAFPFTTRALPYNSEEAKTARDLVTRHSQMQDALVRNLINNNVQTVKQ